MIRLLALTILGLILAGCASTAAERNLGLLNEAVTDLNAAVVDLHSDAGRDVNEPVTGWILATGAAVTPLSFVIYVLSKRTRLYRVLSGGSIAAGDAKRACAPEPPPGGT